MSPIQLQSCLLVYVLGSSFVCAEEFAPHWYAGADFGQGYYSNGGNPNSEDSERHRLAGGVHLGHQFNRYLSTELAYQYMGKAQATSDPMVRNAVQVPQAEHAQ